MRMGPMVELFPERRRAELFARALDGHAAPADGRLQELLDTASRLAAVPLVEPREEFRDSLRARLMAAAAAELPAQAATTTVSGVISGADTKPAPSPARHRVTDEPRAARRRRRLVAVATGLVLVGGGTGVAAASEQALPGDVLYPVKRTLESAEVGFATGDADEGRAMIERATTRLDEVQALNAALATGGSRPDSSGLAGVESALRDFTTDASTGGSRLLQAYSQTGDPADLHALRDFTAESHSVLRSLSGSLPPQAQSFLSAADDVLVRLDTTATQACPDCTTAPPLQELPTEPAGVPDVAPGATPDLPPVAPDRSSAPRRQAKSSQPAHDSAGRHPTAPTGSVLELPDLSLGGTGGQQQHQQGTSPSQGGGSDAQQGPLDLGSVLSPEPGQPQRTVDAPLPRIPHRLSGGLGDVTQPLTDPLPSLLDGAGNTVDNTTGHGDLGGLLP